MFAVVEADFEKGVGLLIDDNALGRNEIFCCQSVSPSVRFRTGDNSIEIANCQLAIADLAINRAPSPPTGNRQSAIGNNFELVQKVLDIRDGQA